MRDRVRESILKTYARVNARHTRSVRALEKLGFVEEGILRLHRLDSEGQRSDEVWYGLLHSEWRAAK